MVEDPMNNRHLARLRSGQKAASRKPRTIEVGIITDYRGRFVIEALLQFWPLVGRTYANVVAANILRVQIFNEIFGVSAVMLVIEATDGDFWRLTHHSETPRISAYEDRHATATSHNDSS